MITDIEEIARRMDALSLWDGTIKYNWLLKPKGTVYPYFFDLEKGRNPQVSRSLHFIEGWQSYHNAVFARDNADFGVYTTPLEYPQFEVMYLKNGTILINRYDTGYAPRPLTSEESALMAKLMWESYGVMLELEDNPDLPISYMSELAMFARVEVADNVWRSEGVKVPQPPAYSEKVSLLKSDIEAAKVMGVDKTFKVEVDLRMMPSWQTREPRPRVMYLLAAVDSGSGQCIVADKTSLSPELSLKQLWEKMPQRLFKKFISFGRFPCEIKVSSGRMFRFLRIFCQALDVKISLHDQNPALEDMIRNMF